MTEIELKLSKTQKVIVSNDFSAIAGKISGKAMVVTEKKIADKVGEDFFDALYVNDVRYITFYAPEGEKKKDYGVLEKLLCKLVENRFTKEDYIIAFGGGTVSDLCAVAADLYMRGIKLINVPTTLLSMVDASISGKGAINMKDGKNVIGVYYPAELVYVNTELCKTLPAEQVDNGIAEIIKYGMIYDPELLPLLELKDCRKIICTESIIGRCINVKKAFVEKDEFDNGERKKLNFGHTIGHAIEKASDYRIPHGKAVIYGMIYAEYLLTVIVNKNVPGVEKLRSILSSLNIVLPDVPPLEKVLPYLEYDKKYSRGNIDFIMVKELGKAEVVSIKTETLKPILEKKWKSR